MLIGIPRGPVTVSANVDGYERYRSSEDLAPGGQTKVALVRKAGLREVDLTLSAAAGRIPANISFRVIEGEVGETVLRQSGADPRRTGEGWRLTQRNDDPRSPGFTRAIDRCGTSCAQDAQDARTKLPNGSGEPQEPDSCTNAAMGPYPVEAGVGLSRGT